MLVDIFYAACLVFENETTKRPASLGIRISRNDPENILELLLCKETLDEIEDENVVDVATLEVKRRKQKFVKKRKLTTDTMQIGNVKITKRSQALENIMYEDDFMFEAVWVDKEEIVETSESSLISQIEFNEMKKEKRKKMNKFNRTFYQLQQCLPVFNGFSKHIPQVRILKEAADYIRFLNHTLEKPLTEK